MSLNLWDTSVPDVLYTFFGNHYNLLNKWATTLTGWRDFQQCSMPAQNDIWRSLCSATNDAKIYTTVYSHFKMRKKNRLWQLKAIKWNEISPCLRKIHCDIWNALVFTNVIDHWLQTLVCSKRKIGKMSFGTYIHSLQSSVFATRKKKVLQRQEIGLLFVLVKA